MHDQRKTKTELLEELGTLRARLKKAASTSRSSTSPTSKKPLNGSERKYRDLFENASEAIYLIDAEQRYVDVNRKGLETLGFSREELLGKSIFELIPKEQKERSREEFAKLKREGGYNNFRGKVRTKDGRWLDVEVSSTAVFEGGVWAGSRDILRDISEQVRSEQALKENEARLKVAQRIAHVGDWEWDIKTNEVHWSDELYRINGFEPGEIAPNYGLIREKMHPEDKPGFLAAIDAALNGERPFELDYRFSRRDGAAAVVHTIGRVIRDETGAPVRMVGIVQDITQQKKAEQTIRDSENKFRTIFDSSSDGILIADRATKKFLDANRSICAMLGYTREELIGLGVNDIHPAPALPSVLVEFEKQARGEKLVAEDLPVLRKDGTVFYADIGATRMMLNGRECTVGVFRDISDRKQVQETLKVSNARLRTLIDTIPDMVVFKDAKGRNLIINKAAEQMTGQQVAEALGKTAEEMLPPDAAAACRESDEAAMRSNIPTHSEEQIPRQDGSKICIDVLKAPMLDETGNVTGLIAIGRDITQRKRTEEALRISESFIRNILDTVDEGFIVIDRDFRILNANKAYCVQASESPEDIIGRHCYAISHRSDRPCHEAGEECAVQHVFRTGEPHSALHRHLDNKGSVLYVETRAFPIKDEAGTVQSVIETVNNITEKHLLEEERLKTQKLEAIGMLAGGIAHDFNNLLQGVFGYISLAKMIHDRKEQSIAMLEQAEQALHLSVNLTKQLLTFSKGGRPVKKRISLRSVIANSVKFALSGSRLDYRISVDPDLRAVEADEGQIGQVIQNIVLNADQAMPLGGTITIAARNIQLPKKWAAQLAADGPYVEICVMDKGIGIAEQYLPRIFDPYFTTKEKGSGLGLATAYSIVKNHGGAIDVASEVGKGSIFSVYLPATEERVGSVALPVAAAPARKGKILVMDDEELIRNIVGEQIRSAGHLVDFAENGNLAIEKYVAARNAGTPFDVIILDLTVRGGMGGKDTIRQLLDIDPGVKAIVSSGYSDDAVIADHQSYGFAACLTKPYEFEALRDMLNTLLA